VTPCFGLTYYQETHSVISVYKESAFPDFAKAMNPNPFGLTRTLLGLTQ